MQKGKNESLRDIYQTKNFRDVFERECSGYPGFITKFRVTDKSSGNETDTVDFENYRLWTNLKPLKIIFYP